MRGPVHLEWESQPLLQSHRPRRRSPLIIVTAAFVAGLLLGLLI